MKYPSAIATAIPRFGFARFNRCIKNRAAKTQSTNLEYTALMPNKSLRVAKTYPKDSKQARHFEILREYYGSTFNEVFFQAAWAVLSPLADALDGTPARTIQRNRGACHHLIEIIYLDAITQANGDYGEGLPGAPSFSGEYEDMGGLNYEESSDDFDEDDPVIEVGVPIATDPFG